MTLTEMRIIVLCQPVDYRILEMKFLARIV